MEKHCHELVSLWKSGNSPLNSVTKPKKLWYHFLKHIWQESHFMNFSYISFERETPFYNKQYKIQIFERPELYVDFFLGNSIFGVVFHSILWTDNTIFSLSFYKKKTIFSFKQLFILGQLESCHHWEWQACRKWDTGLFIWFVVFKAYVNT